MHFSVKQRLVVLAKENVGHVGVTDKNVSSGMTFAEWLNVIFYSAYGYDALRRVLGICGFRRVGRRRKICQTCN